MYKYTLYLHNDNDVELITIRASSLESGLMGAQWLHKGKLVTVPVEEEEAV